MPASKFSRMGPKNPFYGRVHTPESIQKMKGNRKGKALGNQNAKGYKHTPEAIKKIRNRAIRLWIEQRDMMIHAHGATPETILNGTSTQDRSTEFGHQHRRWWLKDKCEWCRTTEDLELDHIIPRFIGGQRTKSNAQTLCKPCNYWKHNHIDLPQWRAQQDAQAAIK